MIYPDINADSLCSEFHKAYDSFMSNNRSASRGWPQQSALAFGLQVEEIPPSNYLNTLVSSDGRFDNSFSDFHFKFKKASANGSGESLTLSHEKTCLKAYVRPEKQEVSKRTREQIEKRKAYELSEKRKAYKKEYQRVYRQTEKGKACRKAHQKAYRESEKGKAWWKSYAKSEKRRAYQKAYRESEKGKAWRKSYEQSEKRRASQKAYRSSEKGRAYQKAYDQREERKAYQKAYQRAYKAVFKNTGNREQARIAGKQAVLLVREPNKVKKNELESTPVSLIP